MTKFSRLSKKPSHIKLFTSFFSGISCENNYVVIFCNILLWYESLYRPPLHLSEQSIYKELENSWINREKQVWRARDQCTGRWNVEKSEHLLLVFLCALVLSFRKSEQCIKTLDRPFTPALICNLQLKLCCYFKPSGLTQGLCVWLIEKCCHCQ